MGKEACLKPLRFLIRQSWERCRALGMDSHTPIHSEATMTLPERQGPPAGIETDLLKMALPYLSLLESTLQDSSYILTLLSSAGACLDVRIRRSEKAIHWQPVQLNPGSSLSEETAGTNAAGTCLIVGKHVDVIGPEHFKLVFHHSQSLASPIMFRGKAVGALALFIPLDGNPVPHKEAIISSVSVIERELRLKAREDYFDSLQQIVTNSGLLKVSLLDADGKVIDISHQSGDLTPAQMNGGLYAIAQEALNTGRKQNRRVRDAVAGEEHEYEIVSIPVTREPSPLGVITLAVDRSHEAYLAKRLNETTALLTAFTKMDLDDVTVTVVDPEGILFYVNQVAARIFCETRENLIGKPIADFLTDQDMPVSREAIDAGGPVTKMMWITGRDGSKRWMRFLSIPVYTDDERLIGAVTMGVEMTPAYHAMERANRAEQILDALFEQDDSLVYLTDANGEILRMNGAALGRAGVAAPVGRHIDSVLTPAAVITDVLMTKKPFFGIRRTEQLGVVKLFVLPVLDPDKEALGALIMAYDASQEDLAHAVKDGFYNNPVIGVVVIDKTGQVRDINEYARRMLTGGRKDSPGDFRFISGYFDKKTANAINRSMVAGESAVFNIIADSTGEEWLEVSVTPVRTPDEGIGAVLSIRDISQRMKLQKKARLVERLEMVGDLATRAAHEFRNPLSSIRAAATIGADKCQDGKAMDSFRRIIGYVDIMDDLLHQFLYLGRSKPWMVHPLPIGSILEQAVEQVENLAVTAGISITIRVESEEPVALIEPGSLCRALVNLLRNAIQAMPQGGFIEVVAGPCRDDESLVEIVIQDTGTGIPEEIRERLFEPFFTTRAGGIGLGLPIVQQIITEVHKGEIRINSEPGEGTSVHLRLPAVKPPDKESA